MTTSTESSTPTGYPAASPKRLRRSNSGSVAGVAKGLGNYFGIETKWIRIALVVSLLFGGAGFLAYIAAWLAIPDEDDPRLDTLAFSENPARLIAGGIFALFAIGAISGTATISLGLLLPAALVGGGVYLLMQDNDSRKALGGQYPKAERPAGSASVAPPPPPAAPGAPVDDDRDPLLIEAERLMTGEAWSDPVASMAHEPEHWALAKSEADVVTRSRRRRAPITSAALGAALLVCVLMLITSSGVGVIAFAAVFLGFSVFGFIASLFFRRPAWALIPASILSLLLVIGAAVIGSSIDDGFGSVSLQIDSVDSPEGPPVPEVGFGVGHVGLDFRGLDLSEDYTYPVDLGAGIIELNLPNAYRVEVIPSGRQLLLLEGDETIRVADGTKAVFNHEIEDGPVLTIDGGDGFGVIEVDRSVDDVIYEAAVTTSD
ncbi:MAG: PspC domain-containing protein [Acidimicrobiales bacterium]|nr:PspC domain-containing protein [Acidimicrobiales bacterium]